ncbi:MAG: cytidine deaminase [Gammaproteobacteria bacterium]
MADVSLVRESIAALAHAYAPYSGFKVGAAVRDEAGRTFSGANVENGSYGLTVCAERIAIFKAISEGAKRICALAVVSEKQNPCIPCGACLQVLAEFAGDASIHLVASDGTELPPITLSSLLPTRFDASVLVGAVPPEEG